MTDDLNGVIKKLLRLPEHKRLYRQRPQQAPAANGVDWRQLKTPLSQKDGMWANAQALHRLLCHRLRKYRKDDPQAQALLNRLLSCNESRRCCDAACALCNYAAQGLWAEMIEEFIEVGIRLDRCVTIIPRGRILPEEVRGRDVVEKARRRFDAAFDAAGITMMVGGFDFDFSEFPDGDFKDHFKPHLHALGLSTECDPGDLVIREHFPAKGSVFRPVEIVAFDGRENWLWYLLKIPNSRKIRPKHTDPDTGVELQAPAQYKPLRFEQHLQQAQLLHELGWSGRLYLRGVEISKSPRGHWRFIARPIAATAEAAE